MVAFPTFVSFTLQIMSKADEYDDDYVAKLLAEDAKKSSANYAARGLSAFLPKRPTSSAPKPNTRFLNHIVREADSHNAALKKKEELEARMRLREMRKDQSRKREGDRDRDRSAGGRDRKKRRYSDMEDDKLSHSRYRAQESKPPEFRRKSSREHDDQHRKHLSTRLSSQDGKIGNEPSKSWKSSKEPRRSRTQRDERSRSFSPTRSSSKRKHLPSRTSSEEDSDPLEDIVGPIPPRSKHPPVHIRGRGATKSRSNIDDHFSDNYDPTQDTQRNSESEGEDEDWDMALEALRDRAMWKRKQSERLREAGWDDAQIQKWAKGSFNDTGEDPDLSSVKWSKKGEERAWDAGKEVDAINDLPDSKKTKTKRPAKAAVSLTDHENAWQRKNNGFLKGFKKAIG